MVSDAQVMLEIFAGSDLAHGRSELTDVVDAKGKRVAKSWLDKRPATVADWEQHLAGVKGIGIPPINSKNLVRWGAIDVDIYQGLSLEALNSKIQGEHLPLVICRSKSGGPHIYLFVRDWVPARAMIEKLDMIAGHLGFATSEIFPKQVMVAVNDFGSWINMPYFGGIKNLRYALNSDNSALSTIPAFAAYVATKSLSVDDFNKLAVSIAPPAGSPPNATQPLPDGPPCLNRLLRQGVGDMRNVILSNIAVYCKKRWGEGWAAHLDEYNRMFSQPLESAEVEAIKKSYGKKDYRYQCQKQPLRAFCSSAVCKRCKYGLAVQDFLPERRSLSMVASSPRIWFLDIQKPNGDDVRIQLATEELQNFRLFQRRCMDTVQQMPAMMKQEDWEPIVEGLMAHVSVIELPPEMTPKGQLKEHLIDFLTARATAESIENLTRGIPYKDNRAFYFRFKDFTQYLKMQRFDGLKPNEIATVLQEDFAALKEFKKIAGIGCRHLSIPLAALPEAVEETAPLPVAAATSPI
jgi:hypothetical protein